jgi:hypothetical protein
MKFTVKVLNAQEVIDDAQDGFFATIVENRKGRRWVSKSLWGCPGNAAENAMVLEEFLNSGGKLDREAWVEK